MNTMMELRKCCIHPFLINGNVHIMCMYVYLNLIFPCVSVWRDIFKYYNINFISEKYKNTQNIYFL